MTGARAPHLALVTGEVEAFSASRNKGCCHKTETTIVVTNKRVLLLNQRIHYGKPVSGLEESFHIEDLKFVSMSHFGCGFCCFSKDSMVLSLNFSSDGNILDWNNNGKVSGCRRYIKLGQKEAQHTYNQLQAMLQARLDSKLGGASKTYVPALQAYPQSPSMPQQYSPAPQMYAVAQQPPAAY